MSTDQISQLLAEINSDDWKRGCAAANTLAALDTQALAVLPNLLEALQSGYSTVSTSAQHALWQLAIRHPEVLQAVLPFVADPIPHVRFNAWWVIDESNDPQRDSEFILTSVLPSIIDAMFDPDSEVRHEAASVLAEYLTPELLPTWLELAAADVDLGDEAWYRATECIPWMGDTVLPYLQTAYQDSRAQVRREAINYLGMIDSLNSVDLLITALSDCDSSVRSAAAHALRWDSDPRLRNTSTERQSLYTAIKQHPKSIDTLTRLLADANANTRISASLALANLDVQNVVPQISALLNDTSEDVRKWAAVAFRQLQGIVEE